MFRLAKSLAKLRSQINEDFPNRDKSSDGWIGDALHASRKSDHNPWVKDGSIGIVTAYDIDEDLNGHVTLMQIVNAIRQAKDPRVKYIIYEGQITVQGTELQRWKPYTGANAHRHHAHISVKADKSLYDDESDWAGIGASNPPAATYYTVRTGDSLYKIAGSFGTSIDTLRTLNLMQPNDSLIRAGQKLRVK